MANKGAAIEASGPSIRILATNMTLNYCIERVSDKNNLETRTWPMSKANDSETELNWRSVSSLNLLKIDSSEQHEALEKEYSNFTLKVKEWVDFREKLSKDVFDASHSKKRRPYHQLFAERLLEKPVQEQSYKLNYDTVPELQREEEVRGQSWTIIAIIGDAKYEKSKETILDDLGLSYFSLCINRLNDRKEYFFSTSDPSDPDVQDYINSKVDFEDEFLQPELNKLILEAKEKLNNLTKEPLVAFFAASEDVNELLKKSDELSKLESLKHADIAVVRMYSWLRLSSCCSAKSRSARDPRAQDFFTKMRPI
jgi:hypothetical protein